MVQGKFLSEEIENIINNSQKNQLNFIQADTGQGKTYAAIHTIPKALGVKPKRVLILIDTNAGKDNKISSEGCKKFNTKGNCPTIMTYAEFGAALRPQRIYSNDFDYIACDEVHNLAKYARIDQVNIFARNPDYDPTTIAMILTRESLNYRAFDTLKRWCAGGNIWMFGFSATPRLLEEWNESEGFLNKIRHTEQLIVYEILEKYSYGDINPILTENPNHKRLIHAPTIEQVQKFTQEIKDNTGRNAVGLWSRHSSKPLQSDQVKTLEYLTQDECFPPDVDDIVATEAYATGYNLNDDKVKEIIIHTGNKDIQTQFKGRKRADLPIMKVYDITKAKNQKKRNKNKSKQTEDDIEIPSEFLNVKLNKQKRDELLIKLNFPKGWNLFCKKISKNYEIIKTKTCSKLVFKGDISQ